LKSDGHGALISDGSEAAKAPSRSHQGSFPDPVFWLSHGNLLLLIFLWISIFSSVFCINPSAVVAVHMLFRLHASATSRMREQSISKKRAQKSTGALEPPASGEKRLTYRCGVLGKRPSPALLGKTDFDVMRSQRSIAGVNSVWQYLLK